jgi:hypothetical protein
MPFGEVVEALTRADRAPKMHVGGAVHVPSECDRTPARQRRGVRRGLTFLPLAGLCGTPADPRWRR